MQLEHLSRQADSIDILNRMLRFNPKELPSFESNENESGRAGSHPGYGGASA